MLATMREEHGGAVVRGEAPLVRERPAMAWNSLPFEVLRVLRAGALIGPGFEVVLVAELLEIEPEEVLERLQVALDLGVPVEDRGQGRFSLPEDALSALTASIIPSLAQAWHRKLGRLLGARAAREAAPPPPPPPPMTWLKHFRAESGDEVRVAEIIDVSDEAIELIAEIEVEALAETAAEDGRKDRAEGGVGEDGRKDMSAAGRAEEDVPEDRSTRGAGEAVLEDMSTARERAAGAATARGPSADRKDMSAAGPRRPVQRRTVLAPPEQARGGRRRTLVLTPEVDLPAPVEVEARRAASPVEEPLVDSVRAAEHMRAAGDLEAAAEHLCAAARKAGALGAAETAVEHASGALELLATRPASPHRQRLRARALLELGRVQWKAPGYEQGFTLARARATLEAARAELDAETPVELRVDIAEALAGVLYDLGDAQSLSGALAELEEASRLLQEAGDPIGAACLFNDQAAVRVRMGDGAGALRLLRASRAIFDARAASEPGALRELAESEHLLARLPLHARLRLGREDEGYAVALQHAQAAERLFQGLGDAREVARVWETMGRLELKRLRIEEARRRLEAAFQAQTALGDLTGLAQTTEFLSEVLGWCGCNAEAIAMLRDSVIYNREKGSPRGLQSNREALRNLAVRFAALSELQEGLRAVEVLLSAGERELGLSAAV